MKKILAVVFASVMLGGCSSILDGPYQQVEVTTWPPDAVCHFSHDASGDPIFSSIVSGDMAYNIRRTQKNVYITCSKRGYADASYVLKPQAETQGGIVFAFTDAIVQSGGSFETKVHLQLEEN